MAQALSTQEACNQYPPKMAWAGTSHSHQQLHGKWNEGEDANIKILFSKSIHCTRQKSQPFPSKYKDQRRSDSNTDGSQPQSWKIKEKQI